MAEFKVELLDQMQEELRLGYFMPINFQPKIILSLPTNNLPHLLRLHTIAHQKADIIKSLLDKILLDFLASGVSIGLGPICFDLLLEGFAEVSFGCPCCDVG